MATDEKKNEQDYEKAMEWLQEAAKQGNVEAQYQLGCLYRDGKGVKQDYFTAMAWFKRAAEQGNADAQRMLENLKSDKD